MSSLSSLPRFVAPVVFPPFFSGPSPDAADQASDLTDGGVIASVASPRTKPVRSAAASLPVSVGMPLSSAAPLMYSTAVLVPANLSYSASSRPRSAPTCAASERKW